MSQSRRSLLILGASLAATLTLAACGGGGTAAGSGQGGAVQDGAVPVVASTNVYGDIAKEIGGEHVSVHSIISKAGADPHGYEANAQDKLAVSKAVIGIENGGGYDDFFSQLSKGLLTDAEIVNVSSLSGLDTGADFNEHVWYSLPTMAKLADELAARFSAELPAEKASFTAQAESFKAKLDVLDTRLAALHKTPRTVAMTEPAPAYLLEQAGFSNTTPEEFTQAVENGSDAPASVVTALKEQLASGTVDLLAYNQQTESPQTEEVKAAAEAAGVPVADFSETLPPGSSYLDWMGANISSLEKAAALVKAGSR
ncbi:zinc/manganese transport system substrate-binding protein [Arthrobacter stackebrandtii]|uniref:Zinc/manganese transport system substrate-binding protein n=1 Tax=Arthrobacter stackebrandtii TaxID=272161 RepID=A0ABS4YZG6_9MICC|nr:zinc ABC transporter substrate-binding protein [Arthrobacter stackebrandtii]MBP2413847.1 zinc/manganese transport system substrate-binding protein [Arthrobacter stackebrandtii]PYH00423.1 ABC transporter substrate-binding protein [Arthrobacter stackebrandtii]